MINFNINFLLYKIRFILAEWTFIVEIVKDFCRPSRQKYHIPCMTLALTHRSFLISFWTEKGILSNYKKILMMICQFDVKEASQFSLSFS